MKNVYLLPTDKPSRLFKDNSQALNLHTHPVMKGMFTNGIGSNQHLYITSSDEEIKLSNWACHKGITNDKYQLVKCTISNKESIQEHWSKIILTTDLELIKDGVQAIDDIFLEWFVNNPDCEWVDVDTRPKVSSPYEKGFVIDNPNYNKIIISKETQKQHLIDIMKGDEELGLYDEPKQIKCYCGHTTYCDCSPLEEPKQESPEEAAERLYPINNTGSEWMPTKHDLVKANKQIGFIAGYKFAEQIMYSEEEVRELLLTQRGNCYVAILTKTKDSELASIAMSAPEPSGKNGWVKPYKKK